MPNAAVITCAHHNCSATTTTSTWREDGFEKLALRCRAGRSAYLCRCHANAEEARSSATYSQENNLRRGQRKANGFTYSYELEMASSDAQMRVELEHFGFIATFDCTTGVEYKSPIYEGLNAATGKRLNTLEQLLAEGHGMIGSGDGTHLHVGHAEHINADTIEYVRRFWHSIFIPLSDALIANDTATAALFGRTIGGWAGPIEEYMSPMEHNVFANVQHVYSIEWRICKFKSAEQYRRAAHFCKDATAAIINGFILKFNDTPKAGQSIRDMRKANADKVAKKLVKLFNKYSAEALANS